MVYPLIETVINEDIENDTIIILHKYWAFDNSMFQNTPTQLKQENQIAQHRLNQLVQFSKATIIFGECRECKELIKIQVKNQTEAKQKIENCYYHFFCIDCKDKQKIQLKGLSSTEAKKHKMLHSLHFKIWERLDEFELSILKEVVQLNTWNEIYNKLVKSNFEIVYEVIEKLDKIHLVEIYRDAFTEKIRELYFLPELINALNVIQNNSNTITQNYRTAKTNHISEIINKTIKSNKK